MTVWLTDSQFASLVQQLGGICIALIGAGAALLAARNSHEAKKNSEEAKNSAAEAASEVKTNGGMSDPNPNLNDHVKYQTEMAEQNQRTMETLLHIAVPMVAQVKDIDERFTEHLRAVEPMAEKLNEVGNKLDDHILHSGVMDKALAEVYLTVKPDAHLLPDEESDDN